MKTLLLAPFARLKKKILWFFLGGGLGICAHRQVRSQSHRINTTISLLPPQLAVSVKQ